MQTLPITEQTTDTAAAFGEGTKIGGCYVLRKNLSKPGESPVWLATDEVLGKDVTLHFVPASVVADARAMTELRQEVKRNRQLIHPNILRVYDFVEDGCHVAISMDAFEGESLQVLLKKKGCLDPEHVKPWIAQLAETLSDAHRIQLFHRDLSPANLYLRPNGGLLAANFGVSRVILNSLERAGLAKGADARLAYLSPQQLDGERPCASDDIYGFGVLLHELLAGAPPFAGDDIVPQIRKSVPAPVSELRAAAGNATAVPASWEKLIAGCLGKTAESRPRNLSEVLALLGQDSGPARPRVQQAPAVEKSVEEKPVSAATAHQVARADEPVTKTASHAEREAKAPDSNVPESPEPESDVPVVEKSTVSRKPLHPEIPPIGPSLKNRPAKGPLSANFPDLDRPRSKAPLVWLVLAAGIIGVGIYVRNMPDSNEGDTRGAVARLPDDGENPQTAVQPPESAKPGAPDLKSPDTLSDPVPVPPANVAKSGQTGTPSPETPKLATPATTKPSKGGDLIGIEPGPGTTPPPPTDDVPKTLAIASAGTGPVGKTAPDTAMPALPESPQPLGKLELPANATTAQLDEARSQREAAIADLQKTFAAADATHQDATRKLDAAKLEKDKRQKDLDAKRKILAPVLQQAEAIEAERKKLEDESLKAQLAAEEATKQVEASRKKLADAVTRGGVKLKARQQAEAELNAATAELATLGTDLDGLSQLLTKADALRQQARVSQQQAEQDLKKIIASEEHARRSDMEAQRKASQDRIAEIDKQMQDLTAQAARFNAALGPLKELGEAGREAIKKIEEKQKATQDQIDGLQAEAKRLTGEVNKLPGKGAGPAQPKPTPPPLANMETNPPSTADGAVAVNSLGMKFVPAGDVQFGVYLTTRKDFEAFATATGLKSDAWRNPGFKQDADHPVVNVTWREAEAFCKWLTEKERKAGLLKSREIYRLPTDVEWSKAVGLPAETGSTPEERDMGVPDVYPWGKQWPPPANAGNYAGEETQTEIPIPNYNDGFPNTSPVGKFRANEFGLYDMGGNVWQWVEDDWNSEKRAKTLRGGSWYNGAIPLSLLSSCRISSSPDTLHDTYGFRIIKGTDAGKGRRK